MEKGVKRIKCIFCSKMTTVHKRRAKKKVNEKVVTLVNAPVHFCKDCQETFLSKEAQEVFEYIKSNSLERRNIMFDYNILEKEKSEIK